VLDEDALEDAAHDLLLVAIETRDRLELKTEFGVRSALFFVYSYDAMGNLLTSALGSHNTTFTYSGTTPKLSSVLENGTPRNVTYDPAGNEMAVGNSAYDYSARNQLVGGDRST